MRRTKTKGIYFEETTKKYVIDKQIHGKRLHIRTEFGKGQFRLVESLLTHKLEEARTARDFGKRPDRTFRDAAIKYVLEHQSNRTIDWDEKQLARLDPYIGNTPLNHIHRDHEGIKRLIRDLKRESKNHKPRKNKTINAYLELVRRILNVAAYEWRDDSNLSWLEAAPKIKLLPLDDARKPRPLTWEEQDALLKELPAHLERMAMFCINTGLRDTQICNLQWSWKVNLGETSAFIIPSRFTKNGDEHLCVLNKIASSTIDELQTGSSDYVFTYKGKPITRMLNSGWKKSRIQAGVPDVRVHDLRHTFGHRLRESDVSYEDRQELLGHRSDITGHYSSADLVRLKRAVDTITERKNAMPILSLFRQQKR